ncbi:MAG: acylphosphatase, partial [Candidatus Brocadia sp.]|nr:acylphosphatase [Candidatus Brocadia sp.]
MVNHTKIHITGIVQGVGFRPFIYNLAHKYNLKGFCLNDSHG